MSMAKRAHAPLAAIASLMRGGAIAMAYLGGAVVAALGLMSAVSIIGRSALGQPIAGDFELVEIGIAVAGSLFLPYCQAMRGHIVVDFFTLRARQDTIRWLDRAGAFLLAAMMLAIGWRSVIAALDQFRSGEVSMVLGFPGWMGYAAAVPGVIMAGIVALAQGFGVAAEERSRDE